MDKIKFTADSTCDLTAALKEELQLDIMPLYVTLGNEHYLDGVNITPEQIYAYVTENKVLPKTAARSPEEYVEFFKQQIAGYDALIHFNISSEVSASNQNAALAAKEMKNVYVIDSRQLSTGTSVLLFLANRLRAEGKSAKEIFAECEAKKENVQTSFVVETLDYLYKGGRCSGLQLLGANLLGLRPYIKMRDGKLGVGKKYKGRHMDKVFISYIDDLAEWFPNYDKNVAFLTHSGCTPEVVDAVKKQVSEKFEFLQVYETVAGSTITSHCGKGTLGLLFLSNEKVVG